MAFDIKGFAIAVNESRLAIEEGKLVIIDRSGKREEHYIDSEIIGKDGFLSKTLEWKENGKNQFKDVQFIKSVNGIQKSKFE
ncbi:hypothetical protein K5E_11210 [Enterococcus thailandicus]|uniref:hypothetical protein n=1 Tax=Enterococcus thailandicus TaxID=417368 RepID=UPI00244D93FF|nr:hypothetical protein [Enterococcus thailandicus]GMC02581.1 hypothetical protein K4E_00910 [Enterococcus thailandicus]GMC08982.1 hypothetical protein K5E_11210 [Enterococcus thailandicus]